MQSFVLPQDLYFIISPRIVWPFVNNVAFELLKEIYAIKLSSYQECPLNLTY